MKRIGEGSHGGEEKRRAEAGNRTFEGEDGAFAPENWVGSASQPYQFLFAGIYVICGRTLSLADFGLERLGDAVGVEVDGGLVAAFDEQSDFWLGAGIAQEHPAFALEVGLGGGEEFLDRGERVERGLILHAEVALGLGIFF